MKRKYRRILCAATYVFFLSFGFAQSSKPTLDFFGTESASGDKEMIKLTQDLFFTLLFDLDTFTITDRRSERFSADSAKTGNYLFYAEILETPDGWQCVLNIIEPQTNKKFTNTKTYENYYKILIESKAALASLLSNLQQQPALPPAPPPAGRIISAESLAGTWKGEQYIDKIMILKGSRGFVIFKNGATMNISISMSGSVVTAIQTSKPNASFFPELPREEALKVAQDAPPIEWRFSLNSDGTVLAGEKKSLSAVTSATWVKQ